jgi:DNA-binding NarL/FixJ family response regulator
MWLSRAEPRFTVRDYADAAALSRCGPRALDIVLLNIGTAVPSAAHVTSIIAMVQAANPGTPVVLFSGVSGRAIAQAARSAGAKGLLHVSADRSLALAVLRLVLAGGTYIPVEASAGDPPDIELRDAAEPPGDPASLQLTRRQSDVLRCLQMGMSNKAIAHDLGICEGTIKVHVRALMTKLGASNRTQAAMFARRPSGM